MAIFLCRAAEDVLQALEQRQTACGLLSFMLSEGMTLEEAMQAILGDMHYAVTQKTPVRYQCNCTREKMERALISIGKQELETLIREDHKAEIVCQFATRRTNSIKRSWRHFCVRQRSDKATHGQTVEKGAGRLNLCKSRYG
ncbi:MAG: Hsp33 family molecular chaperone HslO [Christensenellales bacterium]